MNVGNCAPVVNKRAQLRSRDQTAVIHSDHCSSMRTAPFQRLTRHRVLLNFSTMATGIAQLLNTSGGDADKLQDLLLDYVLDFDSGDDDSILDDDDRDCPTDDDDDFDMTKGDFDSAMNVAMALPELVMGEEEERQKVSAYRYV